MYSSRAAATAPARSTAWKLYQAWPTSRLIALDDAGHGGGNFTAEIIAALNEHRNLPWTATQPSSPSTSQTARTKHQSP